MPRNSIAAVSSLTDLIDELRGDAKTGKQLVHAAYLPGSEARWGDLDPPLPAPLKGATERHGIDRLWSHQAEGIAAARRGEDVLITTPTASGKSLVLEEI
jgi:DEAD/DEAH box helicase domain-containing protein